MCVAIDGVSQDEAGRRMTLIARQLRSEKVGQIAEDFPEIMTAPQNGLSNFGPAQARG